MEHSIQSPIESLGRQEITHTPGPWKLGRFVQHDKTNEQAVYGKDNSLVCDAVWGGSLEISDANARLIAAAPDLLAALKAILDCRSETAPTAFNMRFDRACQNAQDIITRAERKQS